MSGIEWVLIGVNATLLAGYLWLLGYRCGYEAERRRAASSLRFSAALHRANGYGPEKAHAQAEALDLWADRWSPKA